MTTPAPVFAPTVSTYTNRVPYITPAEYQQAATGVDSSNLVPNGTPAANTAALLRIIARASAWVDNLCYQVLAATLDTQAGRYRVRRDGTIAVPLDYSPVIAVAAAAIGPGPGLLNPLADLSGVELGRKVATLPAFGGRSTLPFYGGRVSGSVFAQLTYVNGYANTALSSSAAAGASSITVASPLAIFPGMRLTIADADKTETVTVASSFTPTVVDAPTAVPLTAALSTMHSVTTAVGALPESIKEAAILLTSTLIKTRGSEAFTMPSIGGQPDQQDKAESHGIEDLEIAIDLLQPYRRTA
jgi:hypothetical protein